MNFGGKNVLKRLGFFFFFVFFFENVAAQKVTIKGEVKDVDDIQLIGVNVIVKGTNTGVATNFEGVYTINAEVGQTLVFSYIGKKTEERKVTTKSTQINVVMHDDAEALGDVVVVGYGAAKKVASVVGSVVKVSREEIINKPSASLLDALQGKVAGLSILSTSGEPSEVANIRLHGAGVTHGRTTPLFVLDGSPVSPEIAILLNSSDIESVSVLKDASATSIYGTRAANGVIYITTRKGKANEPASITFNSQYGVSSLANRRFFDGMMNAEEYADLMVEKGQRTREQADALLKRYPHRIRWDKVFFKDNVPTQQLNLSVFGGGTKTRYYISGGYYKQEGLMYLSGFERFTLRSNIDSEINHWLKMSLRFASGYGEYMTNPNVGESLNSAQGSLAVLMPPIYPSHDENGKRYDFIPIMDIPHPNYWAENNPSVSKNINLTPQLSLEITPVKNVTFTTSAGLQYLNVRRDQNSYPSYIEEINKKGGKPQQAFTYRGLTETLVKNITNTLEYRFNIGDSGAHTVNFLAGQEAVAIDRFSFSSHTEGQVSDRAIMLSHGDQNKKIIDSRSKSTYNSLFARLDYNYDDKYIVDFAVRRDGSSHFGANNRYANFWAAGIMWKATQEKFLKNVSWLDQLNLKFSVGTSGNSEIVEDYSSLFRLRNDEFYNQHPGYLLSTPGNPDLQWQKQLKATLGLNVNLLKTIDLSVDFYNRLTRDMLSSAYVPAFSGVVSFIENGGELQNRGVDINLSLNLFNNSKKGFSLNPFVSLNYNQEKILSLHGGRTHIIGEISPVSFVVGKPSLYFYPIFQKINPETGYAQWYRPGDDPTVTNTDDANVTTHFDRDKLKQNTGLKRIPPLNGSFGLNAKYKTLSLRTLFIFSSGKYMVNNDRYYTENPIGTTAFPDNNQSRVVFDNWKKPGDITRFPSYEHDLPFTQYDSRLIEDASFIRLKELSLSYSLPSDIMQQIDFFKNIRIFASGRNLLTFTKYTGIDPEYDIPVSTSANPITKEYSFGVEFRF